MGKSQSHTLEGKNEHLWENVSCQMLAEWLLVPPELKSLSFPLSDVFVAVYLHTFMYICSKPLGRNHNPQSILALVGNLINP